MINQIRSEWVKLRSVRSSVAMIGLAVLLAVGVGLLIAALTKAPDVASVLGGSQLATVIFMVIGVQIIGQEYRFNTIRPTFSTTPNRSRVVAAKVVVLTAVVTVTAAVLAGLTASSAGLVAELRDRPIDFGGDAARVIAGTVVAAVLAALFGFAIGCIVRQPIAAMMIALTWVFAAETTLTVVAEGVQRWLPLGSASNLTLLELNDKLFPPAAGAVYSLAVSAVLGAVGLALISASDA